MLAVCDLIYFNTSSPPLETNIATSDLSTPKKYQCTECEKGFSRPSALQTHMYTHTKEKPFKCNIYGCERSFSVVSNLRRHFKVHRKHINGDKLSPEDRMRCVRRHIREVEALQYQKQQQYQQYQQQVMNNTSSNSSSSSSSSISSSSSSSSISSNSSSVHSLASLCSGKRLYILDESVHDDFDFPLLSPILYGEAPLPLKVDVLEPCSSL